MSQIWFRNKICQNNIYNVHDSSVKLSDYCEITRNDNEANKKEWTGYEQIIHR